MPKAWTCPDCGRLNDYYPYPTRCSRCGYLHTPEAVPEVNQFMEEWEVVVPDDIVATFSIDPRTNIVDINSFYVTSEVRGAGSLAMQKMVDLADKYGVTLRGIPSPKTTQFREAMTKDQLIRYYERFGFKVEVVNGVESIVRKPTPIPPAVEVPAVPEVTIPEPTRAVTEAEKLALVEYYRKEATKWREIADKETLKEPSREGEQRYASAIQKAEQFEARASELEVKPPGDLECMICHQKFDHLILGTCESCYKKWTKGRG